MMYICSTILKNMKKAVLSIGLLAITTILFSGNGNEKVMICHQLGNGDSISIEVSESAVQAHLDHGDFVGSCRENTPPSSNGGSNNPNNSDLPVAFTVSL